MPTLIGALFLLVGGYCFVKAPKCLFGVLLVSGLFEASSALNIGDRGIQPYYVIAALFVARALLYKHQSREEAAHFKGKGLLAAFAALGVASAFVLPRLFAGLPVFDPSLGLDAGLIVRPPLAFGTGNVAQAGYLIVQVLVVWAASLRFSSLAFSRKAYVVSFYLLAGVIAVQLLCAQLKIAFPYSVLQNNPGYYMQDTTTDSRPTGTFPEPSMAGVMLSLFFAGFLAEYFGGTGKLSRVILAAIAVGVVASSGSLIAASIVLAAMFLFPPKKNGASGRAFGGARRAGLIVAIAFLVAFSPLKETLLRQTVGKVYSNSFVTRISADLYAVDLAASTRWIGVGLGSNRPSSLITSLLSNVGILGTVGFALLLWLLTRNATGDSKWVRWSALAVFVDMAVGVPDITSPTLWIVMALAVHLGTRSYMSAAPLVKGASLGPTTLQSTAG